VALAVLAGIAQSIVLIPIVFLVGYSFDVLIPAGDLTALLLVGGLMIALYLASGALLLWSRRAALITTQHMVERLRLELVRKVQRLPRERIVSDEAAHIHSLLVHDTERVSLASAILMSVFLPAAVFSIALGIALLYINLLLFLTVVAVVPVLTIAMRLVSTRAAASVKRFRARFEEYSRGALFLVERMDLTRSQSAEEVELQRQEDNIEALGAASANLGIWTSANVVAQETVTSVSWSLILVVGGVAVAAGALTIGDVLAFSVAAMMLKRSVASLVGAIPLMLEGRASLSALNEVNAEPDDQIYTGVRQVELARELVVDNVTFSYGASPLLENVDLRLRRGEVTVITGPSGSGKTTLLHLILGYYRPVSGRILADEMPYDDLDIRFLRRQLGLVAQDPVVFAGTVRENVTYGAVEIDEARLADAMSATGADEFVERMRDGMETLVGESGALLSGGQRQRIGLARALYRQPRVLLLDEPTNQLDERLATQLIDHLRSLPWRPALLIATHELARVATHADTILELRGGRLVPGTLAGYTDEAVEAVA
jgi:ABC-type bacteriocin/lantibiotic exporter with double-glycine peptidase domain